jgi:Arc/MetJ family transcription regulator
MTDQQISKRDKTSMVIDRKKVAEAREILGTTTIAETVDAALDEVLRVAAWKRLMERIRSSKTGGIGPTPAELRNLRRP